MKKLLFCLLLIGSNFLSAQKWESLSSGITQGFALALTEYNGHLIAGGSFDSAGGLYTLNIAQWNGSKWDTVSNTGNTPTINDECVYNNALIVAGETFPNVWGISQWNGITWDTMRASEFNSINISEIDALITYQGKLFVSGVFGKNFNSTSTIATWDGNNWDTLPSGVIKKNGSYIGAMAVYNGNLYAGGIFDTAGNVPAKNIAMWNGTTWSAVGDGFNGGVYSLCVSNGTLYAAGSFDSSGKKKINRISSWDGSKWNPLGSGITYGGASALIQYSSLLCVAGRFDSIGGQAANNIAFWDGTNWSTLGSGVIGKGIRALSVYNGALVAAGSFDTAGGIPANNIAQWISPLGINEIGNKNIEVTAYPNPGNGVFNLTLHHPALAPGETGSQTIEVYNMLGEKVHSNPFTIHNSQFTIDLSNQPNGIYLYRVLDETGHLIGEGKLEIQK